MNDRRPFPLVFRNHMWYYKTIVVALQGREKFWWYVYPFRNNTGVWRTRDDSNSRAMQASRG